MGGGRTRRLVVGAVASAALLGALVGVAGADPAPSGADLVLTATAPANAVVAVPHTYTYKVTNQGPDTATGTTLSIHLQGRAIGPSGTVLVTSPVGCSQSEPGVFGDIDLVCPLGDLASGQSVTRQMTVSQGAEGDYTHDASVVSPTPDPNFDNNNAWPTVHVTGGTGQAGGLLAGVLALLAQVLAALHL